MRLGKSLNLKSAARLELFARQHRCCLTESEELLWSALNARQLGVSFRRQAPVGGQFIAAFCAPSIRLIVEVDGAYHARRPSPDARREIVIDNQATKSDGLTMFKMTRNATHGGYAEPTAAGYCSPVWRH